MRRALQASSYGLTYGHMLVTLDVSSVQNILEQGAWLPLGTNGLGLASSTARVSVTWSYTDREERLVCHRAELEQQLEWMCLAHLCQSEALLLGVSCLGIEKLPCGFPRLTQRE